MSIHVVCESQVGFSPQKSRVTRALPESFNSYASSFSKDPISMGPGARRLIERSRQDRKGCARRPQESAKWKVRIVQELRSRSTAPNAWIAKRLAMGHPTRVCNNSPNMVEYRTHPLTPIVHGGIISTAAVGTRSSGSTTCAAAPSSGEANLAKPPPTAGSLAQINAIDPKKYKVVDSSIR
jgi:hypothetical protein